MFIPSFTCFPVRSLPWSSLLTHLKSELLSQTLLESWNYERWFWFLFSGALGWAFGSWNGNMMILIEHIVLGHRLWARPCACHREHTRNQYGA